MRERRYAPMVVAGLLGVAGCYPLYRPPAEEESSAGQVCNAWYEAGTAPPGYEDVGVCAVPA